MTTLDWVIYLGEIWNSVGHIADQLACWSDC